MNVCLTPIGPGPWDMKGRIGLNESKQSKLRKTASDELRYCSLDVLLLHVIVDCFVCRHKVTTMLLPILLEFQSDMLFISAGFDG